MIIDDKYKDILESVLWNRFIELEAKMAIRQNDPTGSEKIRYPINLKLEKSRVLECYKQVLRRN